MKKLPAMLRIGLIAMLTCFLLFSSSYAAENGLVAHYKFKTDFNDSSGNGFNGSIVGAVSLVEDDVVEKHAVFNGGFINIANGPSLQLQNTLHCRSGFWWIPPRAATKSSPFLQK